jgi:5,10-methylenetetrahydromethanopterin reductase
MRIALRLHGGLSAAACVEQARAAERAGFSTVWFAENPFNRGVLPAMAACALATSAIRIGIGVFNPFNRHPTLIAMEMGALDELCGGRAVLGIGAGIKVSQMGLPVDRPSRRYATPSRSSDRCSEGRRSTTRGRSSRPRRSASSTRCTARGCRS